MAEGRKSGKDRIAPRPTCIPSCSTFRVKKFRRSLLQKMKSSVPPVLGLLPPSGLDGHDGPEMFVAIIICLRGHRYSVALPPMPLSPYPPHPLPFLNSLFCLLVFPSRFATLAWHEPPLRSFCLSANVRGIVRFRAIIPGRRKSWKQMWSPREDKRRRGTRTRRNVRAPERTLREQETNKRGARN